MMVEYMENITKHYKTSRNLFISKMLPTHHLFSFEAFTSASELLSAIFFPSLISLLRFFSSMSKQISNKTFSLLKRNVQALKLIFGV